MTASTAPSLVWSMRAGEPALGSAWRMFRSVADAVPATKSRMPTGRGHPNQDGRSSRCQNCERGVTASAAVMLSSRRDSSQAASASVVKLPLAPGFTTARTRSGTSHPSTCGSRRPMPVPRPIQGGADTMVEPLGPKPTSLASPGCPCSYGPRLHPSCGVLGAHRRL